VAASTSRHLKLLDFKPQLLGKNVWLRFRFDTGEAMGMNMVTLATQAIAALIKQKLNIDCVALSGNFCVDKKPSLINFVEGRGKKVWAEAVIKRQVVKDVLKTIPEAIIAVVHQKQWLGSIMSGSIGANAHFANITAAIFLSTGQDLAHVVEASVGVTTAELENKDLYFSVYLPDLMVGTVGGGTRLESQQQALKMLGNPDSMELAQIIGGAVLAGELSLTAALATSDLAQAHQKLGRPHAK
jgi:hydroxymethylglutaryl-CoA reductase (NADPH)